MENTFIVITAGIIYNQEGKYLIIKRSKKESHAAGIFAYPGGKTEYTATKDTTYDILETNLQREIMEEVNIKVKNITYLSSHAFVKESGENAITVAFICEYESGEAKAMDTNEVAALEWLSLDEILNLTETYPVVKTVYKQAAAKLEHERSLHHIYLGGLVINDNHEFLLVQKIDNKQQPGKLTFPGGPLGISLEPTWEAMEASLAKAIFSQTGIEIADGPIPFTDQAFVSKDNYDRLIQFFICRYRFGKPIVQNPNLISRVLWKKFADFDKQEFSTTDYLVFEKANKFISRLAS